MPATTGQLGLVTPTQGDLSGTWGNTVNNGITEYTNIAIAGTLTLSGDGAVTLENTTGNASATNITASSTLAGAGTATAQFALVKVTGTLTTTKVVTFGSAGAPPYSKTYTVVNAATGGSVSFTAYGGTGVTIAVGESAFVYFNGTNIVKVSSSTATGDVVGPASATANGIALFNSTTGKLIKDSSASDGLIYGITVGRGTGAVATNLALGIGALQGSNSGNGNNIAIGYEAGRNNTTGAYNTWVGGLDFSGGLAVGRNNTTGQYNAGFGAGALAQNTTASENTAVGYQSLHTSTTSSRNTAVGYRAGYLTTSGHVTAIGSYALSANTTGNSNVAVGGNDESTAGALQSNTTGSSNTAVGVGALKDNTTASNNTAVGYQAGYTNTTGPQNTFIGHQSGYNTNNATGYNTFVGRTSGYSNTTGYQNTFFGGDAGYYVTTGNKNTILGMYNGNQGSLDIRTASNYVVLSDGDGNPRMYNDATNWYDAAGKLRAVPQSGSSKTASYTLATTDIGEYILLGASGAIVIPDATFAAGDVITIFNNTASTATITCSITTAYIAGTFTDKATMTLAAAGVATVLFITSTLCVVSGNVT